MSHNRNQKSGEIKFINHYSSMEIPNNVGLNIKLKLNSPTILHRPFGKQNGFIHEICNINDEIMNEANTIDCFHEKIKTIIKHGGKIEYFSTASNIFNNNLLYIDYCLPKMIGLIIYKYYFSSFSKISDIVNVISIENPLGFDKTYNQDFYIHKVKKVLFAFASGLRENKVWNNRKNDEGVYMVITKQNDMSLCDIYNKNQFEDYLYNNTSLDTPSTSRHNFGDIYKKDNEYFINLNLQIRFK